MIRLAWIGVLVMCFFCAPGGNARGQQGESPGISRGTADIITYKPVPDSDAQIAAATVRYRNQFPAYRPVLDDMGVRMVEALMTQKLKPRSQSAVAALSPNFAALANGYSPLGSFMRIQGPISESLENSYANITYQSRGGKPSTMYQLAQRILAAETQLDPPEVMTAAIEVCEGDVPLAALTVHNLLKEVKYRSIPTVAIPVPTKIVQLGQVPSTNAETVTAWGYKKKGAMDYKTCESVEIMKRLKNLRPQGDEYSFDHIGPWYHAFGLFFTGTAIGPGTAEIGAMGENFWRHFGIGSSFDPGKMEVNNWAAALTYALTVLDPEMKPAAVPHVPANLSELSDEELGTLLNDLERLNVFFRGRAGYDLVVKAIENHIARLKTEGAKRVHATSRSLGAKKSDNKDTSSAHKTDKDKPEKSCANGYWEYVDEGATIEPQSAGKAGEASAGPGNASARTFPANPQWSHLVYAAVFTWSFDDSNMKKLCPGDALSGQATLTNTGREFMPAGYNPNGSLRLEGAGAKALFALPKDKLPAPGQSASRDFSEPVPTGNDREVELRIVGEAYASRIANYIVRYRWVENVQ
jgi:hypothetical protein